MSVNTTMTAEQRRRELGALLQSRRKLLLPKDVGLGDGFRRRTPGLRREEVAMLASVSVSWYTWLEQGRQMHPSRQVLSRIARTLHLSQEELLYITLLSEPDSDDLMAIRPRASVSIDCLQTMLDAFCQIPAILYNCRFDIVAGNPAALAVYGKDAAGGGRPECNMLWRFFKDPDRRRMYPDGTADRGIRNLVEALRMNWAAAPEHTQSLIDELRCNSPEFDAMWGERRVSRVATFPGTVRLPQIAQTISVRYSRFILPDAPGYTLAALVPAEPESGGALNNYLQRKG